jgi:predicted HNH restriction endonuclease
MDRFERAERRRQLRVRAVEYLGGQCAICKYAGCLEAFDFHHADGGLSKDFNISSRMTSWKAIENELKKCVLLCARCHRELHAGHHPGSGYLEDFDTSRSLD